MYTGNGGIECVYWEWRNRVHILGMEEWSVCTVRKDLIYNDKL